MIDDGCWKRVMGGDETLRLWPGPETVSCSHDRFDVLIGVYPQFSPQPLDVHVYLSYERQENRSWNNFSGVLRTVTIFGVHWLHYFWILPLVVYPYLASPIMSKCWRPCSATIISGLISSASR